MFVEATQVKILFSQIMTYVQDFPYLASRDTTNSVQRYREKGVVQCSASSSDQNSHVDASIILYANFRLPPF